MGLVDLRTNLKSLRYGKDTVGGGNSAQPFVTRKIPDDLSDVGRTGGPDFLLRGGTLLPRIVPDMTKQLLQAEGYAAATETYGKSSDRAIALETLGDYGRNNARFLETVASAHRQSGRNMAQISGQFQQADTQAMGTIYEAPMPEMHVGKYQYKNGGLNSALTIMNGLSAFFKNTSSAFLLNPSTR